MSPLVGCPGPGGFLSGGAFVCGVFCPGALLAGGTLGRGCFCPGGLLPGGDFCPTGNKILIQFLMPVPPKFNAYTHRLGFLCLAS